MLSLFFFYFSRKRYTHCFVWFWQSPSEVVRKVPDDEQSTSPWPCPLRPGCSVLRVSGMTCLAVWPGTELWKKAQMSEKPLSFSFSPRLQQSSNITENNWNMWWCCRKGILSHLGKCEDKNERWRDVQKLPIISGPSSSLQMICGGG